MAKGQVLVEFQIIQKGKNFAILQKEQEKHNKSLDTADKKNKKLNKSQDQVYTRQRQGVIQTANSTKNFSKLSQTVGGDGGGPGGLVRAYALLAANVFALTAAFGVLSRSAQIDTLTESMKILSTTGGTFIENLAKQMRDASGGAIDLAQAFRQVSLASSAGLSTKEIEGLTLVARGAAISLGRNLPDAMDRIFRGAIKLEPEILDEIGLFVRVDEAAERYGATLNKSASSLSQAEKRQGFLNEILRQGTEKFEEYAIAVEPDVYVKLAAALADIAQSALSLMGGVLNPMIGLLAENKAILGAVFGSLVAVLLKKAIPAMGLFTKSQAENAAMAASNAQQYTKDLEDGVNAKVKADRDIIKSTIKTAKKTSRAGGFGTVGGKDKAGQEKVILGLQNKKIKGAERAELVQKRITTLETKQGFQKRMQNKLAKKEYDALILERIEEEKLLNIQKQKVNLDKTSLGFKRQEALDRKAAGAGVLAESTGLMETSSISAGWGNLNEKLSETENKGGKQVKKFGLMQRSSLRLQGGVAALTTGMSKFMMTLGPIMMLIGMLTPIVLFLAKKFGILSKESKAAGEAISQAEASAKEFIDRGKKQAASLTDQSASYRITQQASLAYANAQKGAFEGLQIMNERLEEFDRTATDGARAWEAFKSIFGLDKESKAMDAQLDQFKKSFETSLRAGDVDMADLFLNLEGFEGYKTQLDLLIAKEKEVADSRKEILGDNDFFGADQRKQVEFIRIILANIKKTQGDLDDLKRMGIDPDSTGQGRGLQSTLKSQTGQLGPDSMYRKGGFDKDLIKYVQLLIQSEDLQEKAMKTGKQASDLLEDNDQGRLNTQKKANELAKESQLVQQNLNLALKTGQEAATKFGKNFAASTKVDDIVSGYQSIVSSLDLMNGDVEVNGEVVSKSSNEWRKFLEGIEDGESSYRKYFGTLKKGEKITREMFENTMQPILDYQKAVLTAAMTTKVLVAENKRASKIIGAGQGVADKREANVTAMKKTQANLAKQLADISIQAAGIDRDRIDFNLRLLSIDEKKLTASQKELITQMNIKETYALQMLILAEEEARVEAILFANTETQRAGIAYNKELLKMVKAEEKLLDAKRTGVELDMQIASFRAGGDGTLSGIQTARNDIVAAKEKLQMVIQGTLLQKAILDFEMEVLQERVRIFAEQRGMGERVNVITTTPFGSSEESVFNMNEEAQGWYDAVKDLSEKNKDILDVLMVNAGKSFAKSLVSAAGKAFKAGSGGGMKDSIQGIAAGMGPQTVGKDKDGNDIIIDGLTKQEASVRFLKNSYEELAATMGQFGPAGIVVAGVAQGGVTLMKGMENQIAGNKAISDAVKDTTNDFTQNDAALARSAETAAFAGQALSSIGQIMAAQSAGQMAQVDQQIAAEKKRDGQSEASLAKIAALEKKKEAIERKAFDQNKKVQMAVTIANTASSIMAALSAPPIGLGPKLGMPMAIMAGAMGALQLGVIASTSYQGGGASGVQKPKQTSLSIGGRGDSVDTSRRTSSGELSYLRGETGSGTNANNFRTGGATGIKGYATGQPIMVGEQGPERIDIVPNEDLGRSMGTTNINFNISAVDGQSVQRMLNDQQGNIIGMIQSAANETGEEFLPQVDPSVYGTGG